MIHGWEGGRGVGWVSPPGPELVLGIGGSQGSTNLPVIPSVGWELDIVTRNWAVSR